MSNWCLRSLVSLLAICVIFLQGDKHLSAFGVYLLFVVPVTFTWRHPWSLCRGRSKKRRDDGTDDGTLSRPQICKPLYGPCDETGDWTDDGIGLLHVIRLRYSIFRGAVFCGMRIAECGKLSRGNLRKIKCGTFRKLPLVAFPHSAAEKFRISADRKSTVHSHCTTDMQPMHTIPWFLEKWKKWKMFYWI